MSDVETTKRRYSMRDEDERPLEAEERSYGVLKSEAAARFMSQSFRYAIFAGIALAAYAVSLDQARSTRLTVLTRQYTSTTYETQALATSFGQHSLIAVRASSRTV